MKRLLAVGFALFLAGRVEARYLGFGVDAFNRVVPVAVTNAAAFSPISFEIDSVVFAEAVDPIRRARFSEALHVMDEFEAEFQPLARMPFERPNTNGFDLVWAHALVVDEPRRIDPTFRLAVQDLYGVEVCRANYFYGIEAWIRTRFAGDFDGWRLPPPVGKDKFALHDIVSVSARVAPTNGWKRALATHFVYRQPLAGGPDFYALVPKPGRSVSSLRTRLSSLTVPELVSKTVTVVDPEVPARLALPRADFVSTNSLIGAFSYFKLPTAALKPFPPGARPSMLRQIVRFHLENVPASADAERLTGPFLFFIYDRATDTIPVVGILPETSSDFQG